MCSRLPPARQERAPSAWELAITKTGGYLLLARLLALLSAFFHSVVFQAIGTPAPIALARWVGFVSQFLPVVGTYLAGILPAVLTFLDSPLKAVIVVAFIVIYQQVENYVFAPRITARTMELHPAVAFGAAWRGILARCRRSGAGAPGRGHGPSHCQRVVTTTRSSRASSPRSVTHRVWKRWSKIRKAARRAVNKAGKGVPVLR